MPNTKRTTVYLDPDVYRRARLFCAERDTTLRAMIDDALRAWLAQNEPTSDKHPTFIAHQ